MKVESLYVIAGSDLEKFVANWAGQNGVTIIPTSYKNEELNDLLEGVLIFHNNYEFNREDSDLVKELGASNMAIHKVDLNGTLVATLSNVEMWLDNNRPKSLLLLGDKNVIQHEHLTEFLGKI